MRFLTSILVSSSLALAALVPFSASAGPVDINTADASTLAKELNGIGPARAQAIVAYRSEHGPFKSADDLRLVKNMPQKVIDSNRDLLKFDGSGGGGAGRGAARPPAAKVPEGKEARSAPR